MKNPNCDGEHCTNEAGEVRFLPYGGGGNILCCFKCYLNEMKFRTQKNNEGIPFEIPKWKNLKVYSN
jgi:hypothetical protein